MENYNSFLPENQSTEAISSCLIFPQVNISSLSKIQESWIYFLNKYPWVWFVTLTFHEDLHPEQADKRYFRYVRAINELIYGKRYFKKGLGIIHTKAIEYQKRGVIHFHCLMGFGVEKLNNFDCMDLWLKQGNGFARIYPYTKERAEWYVSKYVAKGGEIDLVLSPAYRDTIMALQLPLSLGR